MTTEQIPDKDYMYGKFQKTRDWKDKLHKKLAHKSLDIDENDDLNVDNSKHNYGLDWKSLAVLAAALLGGGYMVSDIVINNETPAAVSPVDSEYDVRFYDANGNLIDVPHISQKPS